MTNALEVRGLHKQYASFSLNDVSFTIPAGYIMGFIGPNGAGKTTTIKSILNMTQYPSGEVRMFGMDHKENAAVVNERIGVVMDTPFYSEDWRVSDVERALAPFYTQWDRRAYAGYLSRFKLAPNKKIKELSRGMKVKLMMAAALSHASQLLILDEPTSGLDPVARDELCDILGEFITDERKSILFSTHITADLEKIADYITFILDGRIVYTGTKEQLLEKYVLVKGGLGELTSKQEAMIIGTRRHDAGFEGLTETANLSRLPKSLLYEPVSLDEIIIFMNNNKGANFHEQNSILC